MLNIKRQLSIIFLGLLTIISFIVGINFSFNEKVYAETNEIVISDDFTAKGISATKAIKTNNVATDENGHVNYGLIPIKRWGGQVVLMDDAYIVYKIDAGSGFVLNNVDINFLVGFGHNQIAMQANKSDIKIAVSKDNFSYEEIFSLRNNSTLIAEGETEQKATGITEQHKKYNINLNLNGDKVKSSEFYIKLMFVTPSANELTENFPFDNENNKLLPIARVSVNLYITNITATKQEIQGKKAGGDFTTDGKITSYNGVIDYNNLAKDEIGGNKEYGVVPSNVWSGIVNISDGYLTLKISADDNFVFSSATLNLNYKFFASDKIYANGEANIIVETSCDNRNYTEIYNLFNEKGISSVSKQESLSINLDDVAVNYGVLYVKIKLQCPTNSNVALNCVPICLYGAEIFAPQKSMEMVSVINHFGKSAGGSGFDKNIVEKRNVCDGNYLFGLIPTNVWGGVVNSDTGYFTYKLSAGENKKFDNLRIKLSYRLVKGGNIVVYAGSELNGLGKVFDAVSFFGDKAYNNNIERRTGSEVLYYQTVDFDIFDTVYNSKEIFVKIVIEHPQGKFALQKLKTNFYSVMFNGLTSVFDENQGQIIYNLNGGMYEAGSNPKTYNLNDKITLIAPVKQFCVFKGWYNNKEFTGETLTELDTSKITTYRLFAKWESNKCNVNVTLIGSGSLTVNGNSANNGDIKINAGEDVKFILDPDENYLIYSLSIGEKDVFLFNGNEYLFKRIESDIVVEATFKERAVLNQSFSVDYTDNVKYGNNWKDGLYDYNNLYITDEEYHSLGVDGGQGYIVYKFVAPENKLFESAFLTTYAKLFDFYLPGTNEKLDYYISYDNVEYQLIYKSRITKYGLHFETVSQNLTEYVMGKKEFYVKIELGSNSANWTLLQNLKMDIDYAKVAVTVDFNGLYTETFYNQYKGEPLNKEIILPKEGYYFSTDKIYLDNTMQTEYNSNEIVNDDISIYVEGFKSDGKIEYNLDGGTNNPENPQYYNSEKKLVLSDPVKEGYIFAGWYVDSSCNVLITEIAQGRTGNITLYAKWIKDESFKAHKITYELNGGINSAENPDYFIEGKDVILKDASKNGFVFDGWYTTSDFKNKVTSVPSDTKEDIKLYAKWIGEPYVPDEPSSGGGCGANIEGNTIIIGLTLSLLAVVILARKNSNME